MMVTNCTSRKRVVFDIKIESVIISGHVLIISDYSAKDGSLSKQIFKVAGEEYNRSSEFFEREIRDYEYDVIMDLAFEAIKYEDIVMVNAPFTQEIRDDKYIADLRNKLKDYGAKLSVIWIVTDPEVCHQRMIDRASDRDTWKLANWEEYLSTVNFTIPENLRTPDDEYALLLYHNSTDEMAAVDFAKLLDIFNS